MVDEERELLIESCPLCGEAAKSAEVSLLRIAASIKAKISELRKIQRKMKSFLFYRNRIAELEAQVERDRQFYAQGYTAISLPGAVISIGIQEEPRPAPLPAGYAKFSYISGGKKYTITGELTSEDAPQAEGEIT